MANVAEDLLVAVIVGTAVRQCDDVVKLKPRRIGG